MKIFSVNVGLGSVLSNIYRLELESGSIGISKRKALTATNFGYSSAYKALMIGSSSSDYTLDDGAVTVSINYDPASNTSGSFSGNGNEILFRNYAQFITANAANDGYIPILTFDNGKVGIGTTAPTRKLEVIGTCYISGGLDVASQKITNVAAGTASNDAVNVSQMNTALSSKIGGSGTIGRIAKFTASNNVADSGIWDTGVNIGIGTTAPTRKLEVIGNAYISGGLDVASQKITNVAAGTASNDAVNVSQLSGVGSKWTLTGTDIYRLSNVIIGNNYALQMYNTSNVAQAVLKLNTANHIELNTPNDLYLLGNGNIRLKMWGASNGAISIGQQPTGIQHALQVANDSAGNLWTFRAIFNSQKNNNFQVGDSSTTFFSINNLFSNSVDIGNKTGIVATNVLYTFETANEMRHRFDGNQFGDNNIGSRIMKRMAACINCAALQTQATCSIAFNTSAASSSNHRFIVEIEGTITGIYFKYTAVIFYANSAATVTAVTALNSITNCNAPTVSVVSNQVVLQIGKSTGNFTYSNLIITTRATGYSNGIDQAAPAVSNITFA